MFARSQTTRIPTAAPTKASKKKADHLIVAGNQNKSLDPLRTRTASSMSTSLRKVRLLNCPLALSSPNLIPIPIYINSQPQAKQTELLLDRLE